MTPRQRSKSILKQHSGKRLTPMTEAHRQAMTKRKLPRNQAEAEAARMMFAPPPSEPPKQSPASTNGRAVAQDLKKESMPPLQPSMNFERS